jgi:alpha-methylacyl-CoA racemase
VSAAAGPLADVRVVEIAGVGPGPFCGMLLADMGAEVIRVDRAAVVGRPTEVDAALHRDRRSIGIDLKQPEGAELVLRLVERADALFEGFRPGVAERLGIGPEVCLERRPSLAYGRITGWGQDGPLNKAPGHDINYMALNGALAAIGEAGGPPVPPLNLVGDFGGGGMLLAVGLLGAIISARATGTGQVVDAAMCDGSSLLMTMMFGMEHRGAWSLERGTNLLDGGAPFYSVYKTADGGYISLACLEPQFFAALVEILELEDFGPETQRDRSTWPALRTRLTEIFRGRPRSHWEELFDGEEICFAPVLTMAEAPDHPHNVERRSFIETEEGVAPQRAPRFSSTGLDASPPQPYIPGAHTAAILSELGCSAPEVERLTESGVVRQAG